MAPGENFRSVAGGFLVQSRDLAHVTASDLKVVTKRAPTAREVEDMLFAFTIAKHVKSNAIVYAKDGQTAGIGAGQMNRKDSARIAALRAAGLPVAVGAITIAARRAGARTPELRATTRVAAWHGYGCCARGPARYRLSDASQPAAG